MLLAEQTAYSLAQRKPQGISPRNFSDPHPLLDSLDGYRPEACTGLPERCTECSVCWTSITNMVTSASRSACAMPMTSRCGWPSRSDIRSRSATCSKATSRPSSTSPPAADLNDLLSVGVDKMQRNFEPLKQQINDWKTGTLIDDQAKVIIYEVFVGQRFPTRLLPAVHQHYFQPSV